MSEQSPELSYEQARDELVDVVRRLEEGGTTLEESLTLWERGEELARDLRALARGCPGAGSTPPGRTRPTGRMAPRVPMAPARVGMPNSTGARRAATRSSQ